MSSYNLVNYFGKDYKIYYPLGIEEAVINAIKAGRIWEKKLLVQYSKFIDKNDVVLDIGGYLGTHTLAFAHLVGSRGKVHTFEPQISMYKLLTKTIKESKYKNVKLYNKAVYSKKDIVEFFDTETGKASIKHIRPRLKGKVINIDAITIDSLNLRRVDLIKIDVEKGEWHVLEGAHRTLLKHKPIIFIETFKTKNNLLKLDKFCSTYKYNQKNIGGADFILFPVS
tara:strand:+ start:103 stop:777 length:675 start_codon:yes stop_codon:yes gene_type:complete